MSPTRDDAGLPHHGEWVTRVLIMGVTGSGKSTLALRLGNLTGLPAHLSDDEFGWLPGWVQRPVADQARLGTAVVNGDSWVIDSAYSSFRDAALARAQLLICLDYSRARSFWQLLRRSVRRVWTRERVCNGNVETLRRLFTRDSILRWHATSFAGKRRRIRAYMAAATAGTGPATIRFASPKQLHRWVATLPAQRR